MSRNDPHSYADADHGTISEMMLGLNADFPTRRLSGTVTLRLSQPSIGVLDLDTRDLEIQYVTAGGASARWEFAEHDSILGSCLRVFPKKGSTSVTIQYAASPDAMALQWLNPEQTFGKSHPLLYSQCQAIHARSIVPVQDTPSIRFPYRATVRVAEPYIAIMSAAPGRMRRETARKARVYSFAMPQPIPAYLLALAVGNIASYDIGPRSRVYAEPEVLEQAAWEFAETEQALQKAEKLFGRYRWERYDFMVMPPAFPYGGMENARLTFLSPTLLAGDRSLLYAPYHELLHPWTGNLVTNATWNDFWLNEGWTTWATWRLIEALQGKEAAALMGAQRINVLTRELNRFGRTSPMTQLKTDLSGKDPDEAYSSIPYDKGLLFLVLLEQTVGRKKFAAFVRNYIERFSFCSISTEQFLAFLENSLPGVAKEVSAAEWVYNPDLPLNAPTFRSRRLERIRSFADSWESGLRPTASEANNWSTQELVVYLTSLPNALSRNDCALLDGTFRLTKTRNAEVLAYWLTKVAASQYMPAFPRLRKFLGDVGRMAYLRLIYRALAENEATKPLARELFNAYKERYHPIARNDVQRILGE